MALKPYTSPLLGLPGIRHGFFTRQGGVSKGVYSSLNCGPGSSDDPEAVQENRDRVAAHLLGKAAPVNTLYQIHSSTLVHLDKPLRGGERPRADALITRKKGLILGVLTADCAPILFADPKAGIVASAHAGWRGALDEIIENVVANMVHMGSNLNDIHAIIGPCISKDSYEVGPEFRDQFLKLRPGYGDYFMGGKPGKFQFDLQQFCLDHLKECGVKNYAGMDLDTYSNSRDFFSFRRTMQARENDYGRQISAIVMV